MNLIRIASILILILLIFGSVSFGEYVASSPAPFSLRPKTKEEINITIVEPVKSIDISNIISYDSSESNEITTDANSAPAPDVLLSGRHKTFFAPNNDPKVIRDARVTQMTSTITGDSYLEAYRQSHAAATAPTNDANGQDQIAAEPTIAHPTYYEPQYSLHKDMKPPATSRISYYHPPSTTHVYHDAPVPTAGYHYPKPTYSYDYHKEPVDTYGHHQQPVGGYVATSFGHHQVSYGPPSVAPPVHHQVTYVAPTQQVHHHHMEYDYDDHRDHHESYGVPYQAPGIFDRLKMKFNWYILGKLLLKLILFKKFVKFMAILCLLFIIPKFKKGKNDDEEDRSRMFSVMSDDAQAALMQIFIGAMETYSSGSSSQNESNNNKNTSQNDYYKYYMDNKNNNNKYDANNHKENPNCKTSRMLDKMDEKYSFAGLWDLYKENSGDNEE